MAERSISLHPHCSAGRPRSPVDLRRTDADPSTGLVRWADAVRRPTDNGPAQTLPPLLLGGPTKTACPPLFWGGPPHNTGGWSKPARGRSPESRYSLHTECRNLQKTISHFFLAPHRPTGHKPVATNGKKARMHARTKLRPSAKPTPKK